MTTTTAPPAAGTGTASSDRETIAAIATPAGRGALGVVRLSGPRAREVVAAAFRRGSGLAPPSAVAPSGVAPSAEPRDARRHAAASLEPGRAVFGRMIDAAGETIDHGYLVVFEPPRSFTGEPAAELWVHGSAAVLRGLLGAVIAAGARPATPGEFTLRAFLNGRIDITQAEAIRDLIEARTAFQAKVAYDQVAGRIAGEVDRIKEGVVRLVARLEAALEFPDEGEVGRFLPDEGLRPGIRAALDQAAALAATFERGRRVRDGARIAIIGAPNVGKSSLFNKLLNEDRAIVTPVAGTTRDLIEETLDLEGMAVTLMDTAGLHPPRDAADAEAVRRARAALENADLVLLVLDRSRPATQEETGRLEGIDPARLAVVLNKIDRPDGMGAGVSSAIRERHRAVEVSAADGRGLEVLRRRLATMASGGAVASREQIYVTNARHHELLVAASAALGRAAEAAGDGRADEYALVDLRDALDRLGEITGAVGADAILASIFRDFCIGK